MIEIQMNTIKRYAAVFDTLEFILQVQDKGLY